MQEKARAEAKAGHVEQATRRLERLAHRLLLSGQPRLAGTVQKEVDALRLTHTLSDAGEKAIKFGTRALIAPQREESL
jgi:Ca-activated chloride channel family protein